MAPVVQIQFRPQGEMPHGLVEKIAQGMARAHFKRWGVSCEVVVYSPDGEAVAKYTWKPEVH